MKSEIFIRKARNISSKEDMEKIVFPSEYNNPDVYAFPIYLGFVDDDQKDISDAVAYLYTIAFHYQDRVRFATIFREANSEKKIQLTFSMNRSYLDDYYRFTEKIRNTWKSVCVIVNKGNKFPYYIQSETITNLPMPSSDAVYRAYFEFPGFAHRKTSIMLRREYRLESLDSRDLFLDIVEKDEEVRLQFETCTHTPILTLQIIDLNKFSGADDLLGYLEVRSFIFVDSSTNTEVEFLMDIMDKIRSTTGSFEWEEYNFHLNLKDMQLIMKASLNLYQRLNRKESA